MISTLQTHNNGRRLRVLFVVDNNPRECLAQDASSKIHGMEVVTTLERITNEIRRCCAARDVQLRPNR